jgi:hypothetical protein
MRPAAEAKPIVYARASAMRRKRAVPAVAVIVALFAVVGGVVSTRRPSSSGSLVVASLDANDTREPAPSTTGPPPVPGSDTGTSAPFERDESSTTAPGELRPASSTGPVRATVTIPAVATSSTSTPPRSNASSAASETTSEASPATPMPPPPSTSPSTTPPTTGVPVCTPNDLTASFLAPRAGSQQPVGSKWYAPFELWSNIDHDCYFALVTPWIVSVISSTGVEVYHFEVPGDPPRLLIAHMAKFTDGYAIWDSTCSYQSPEVTVCLPAPAGSYTLKLDAYGYHVQQPITVTG